MGSDYVMIVDPSFMREVLTKTSQIASSFHPPHGDTAIEWLTMNEEVGAHQTLNLLLV